MVSKPYGLKYTIYVMDRVKSTIKHVYETIKQMLLLTLMLANRML